MSDQSADAGGTQNSQTDHDRRVRDILDRVAKGQLSSDEAATLLAAAPTADARREAPPAVEPDAQPEPESKPVAQDEQPSAAVWAEVVDEPDAIPNIPVQDSVVDKPLDDSLAAEPVEDSVTAEPVQDSLAGHPVEGSVTGEPAEGAAPPAAETEAQSGEAGQAEAGQGVTGHGESEQVEMERAEAGHGESEHSQLPVPAGVRRVVIRAVGRRVRLIGEPAITGVAVDGPHVIKRDGDTLAISSDGDMGVSIDGFSMLRNRSVGDLKSHVNGFAKELSIRVNPTLQVEIDVTGGSVIAERLPGLSRVRVTAGTAKVSDVDGPIDLLVQAGSATLDAQLTKGRSRVRVESGAANVTLRRGSDVRVHTDAQLGRVTWTGAVTGQSKDVEIGRGRAALDVEVLVGTAQVTSD